MSPIEKLDHQTLQNEANLPREQPPCRVVNIVMFSLRGNPGIQPVLLESEAVLTASGSGMPVNYRSVPSVRLRHRKHVKHIRARAALPRSLRVARRARQPGICERRSHAVPPGTKTLFLEGEIQLIYPNYRHWLDTKTIPSTVSGMLRRSKFGWSVCRVVASHLLYLH
jgi:hypothetical protein